jgi:hypothetical protein
MFPELDLVRANLAYFLQQAMPSQTDSDTPVQFTFWDTGKHQHVTEFEDILVKSKAPAEKAIKPSRRMKNSLMETISNLLQHEAFQVPKPPKEDSVHGDVREPGINQRCLNSIRVLLLVSIYWRLLINVIYLHFLVGRRESVYP